MKSRVCHLKILMFIGLCLLLSTHCEIHSQADVKHKDVVFVVYNNQGKKIHRGKVIFINDSSLGLIKNGKCITINTNRIGSIKTKPSGLKNRPLGSHIRASLRILIEAASSAPEKRWGYMAGEGAVESSKPSVNEVVTDHACTMESIMNDTFIINGREENWNSFRSHF
ncbi:hypothetical protein [Aestuariivivens sediminicola]|uniref:hypothetical protein n=1 Tax=Aestuariivivens sediminicola TaxID=2913560 RepID=UPI001F5AA45F|nr:hypothetical protein [Aestuariivivens sediminicola]